MIPKWSHASSTVGRVIGQMSNRWDALRRSASANQRRGSLTALLMVPPLMASMPVFAQSMPTAPASQSAPAKAAGAAKPATMDGRVVERVITMRATAYGPSLTDNYPYPAVDYFGQPLKPGMVAVDPSVIPLGSTVAVRGYQDSALPTGGFVGQATDTGNAIVGNRIDIFVDRGPAAVSQFGVQPVTVYVLGPAASQAHA
jgi:3D (Asp-Asp-Asp) domain-containing protein